MHVLIKPGSALRLAAHIADVHGVPLCGLNLKLADWHLADGLDTTLLICGICKRKQAKKPAPKRAQHGITLPPRATPPLEQSRGTFVARTPLSQ